MESSTSIIAFAVMATVFYTLYGCIYRLYFSPVAKFPGPKLAALTLWYEFYFDVIMSGSYMNEIRKMHLEHGPIVRINPYELHVADPDFIDILYPTVTKNVAKWSWSAGMFGNTEMTFGTISHATHRIRRGAISSFFSKASVRRLQPVIQSLVDKLCDKLREKSDTGESVNMVYAYSALTHDVVTEYCFSDCRNVLEMENFSPWYYISAQKVSELSHLVKQFPLLLPAMNCLPDWWIRATSSFGTHFRELTKTSTLDAKSVLSHKEERGSDQHPTIFHSLRDDPNLPPSEKSLSRLVAEAQGLVGAGTLTTAHMLSITSYHVLANPPVLSRLMAELEEAIPGIATTPSLQDLEHLPYLSAVICEGFRVSYGTVHRLQRVHPDKSLTFRDWVIPPGTPVGMSPQDLHDDPNIFPEPRNFDPSRWMGSDKGEKLKYLFHFGKGTRQCVGMNLAQAEIHLALATVFRRLGTRMQLYDTDRERDVDVKHDFFVTSPSLQSRGVRVTLSQNSRNFALGSGDI